jgi:hypothetical protein
VALLAAQTANASQVISTSTATGIKLAVNAKGEALLTYTSHGKVVHVLAWGAVNAVPSTPAGKQVAFELDYSGGFDKYYTQDAAVQKLRAKYQEIKNTPGYLANPVVRELQKASAYASSYWNTGFDGGCGAYDGPKLAWVVAATGRCSRGSGSCPTTASRRRRRRPPGRSTWRTGPGPCRC